jgi:hypothetical protein
MFLSWGKSLLLTNPQAAEIIIKKWKDKSNVHMA